MRRMTKRLIGVGTAVVIAVGTAGIAYAEGWLAFGSGKGHAQAAAVQPLTVTVTPGDGLLYPGSSISAVVKIDNTGNNVPVTVQALNVLSVKVDPYHQAGCPSTAVEFLPPAEALPTIPAGKKATVIGGMKMKSDAPGGCQSADFEFDIEAQARVGS